MKKIHIVFKVFTPRDPSFILLDFSPFKCTFKRSMSPISVVVDHMIIN